MIVCSLVFIELLHVNVDVDKYYVMLINRLDTIHTTVVLLSGTIAITGIFLAMMYEMD